MFWIIAACVIIKKKKKKKDSLWYMIVCSGKVSVQCLKCKCKCKNATENISPKTMLYFFIECMYMCRLIYM